MQNSGFSNQVTPVNRRPTKGQNSSNNNNNNNNNKEASQLRAQTTITNGIIQTLQPSIPN